VSMPSWFVPFIREFMGDQNAQFWTECGAKGKVTEHPGVWFLSPSRAKERSDPNPEAGAMLLARTGLYKPAQIKSTHTGLVWRVLERTHSPCSILTLSLTHTPQCGSWSATPW
jgi:hypothetical protein